MDTSSANHPQSPYAGSYPGVEISWSLGRGFGEQTALADGMSETGCRRLPGRLRPVLRFTKTLVAYAIPIGLNQEVHPESARAAIGLTQVDMRQ
jgi:hypothetical protein